MSAANFPQLKVLLIEDQHESMILLKDILMELGVTQIYEANDGRLGLEIIDFAHDLVDIILCDWNMPGMTGLEFLRQIRSAGNNTPFMMITGRSDKMSVLEAKTSGVDGYIRKPYSITQIEAKLRILLHRAKVA